MIHVISPFQKTSFIKNWRFTTFYQIFLVISITHLNYPQSALFVYNLLFNIKRAMLIRAYSWEFEFSIDLFQNITLVFNNEKNTFSRYYKVNLDVKKNIFYVRDITPRKMVWVSKSYDYFIIFEIYTWNLYTKYKCMFESPKLRNFVIVVVST